jgi:ABC-2 type transport system permease protein
MRAAKPWVRRRAQAVWELQLLLRNGEQILLAFIIPIILLIALQWWSQTTQPVAAIITVSALATSFTSLAIGTGFERRSGSLRFLATTSMSSLDLLVGKVLAQAVLAIASISVVMVVAWLLGNTLPWLPIIILLPLGLLTFGSWAFWLAGQFRAEAVLALANGLFLLLIVFGGVVIAPSQVPDPFGMVISVLPTALLADGLRGETAVPVAFLGLLAWGVIGAALARRSFKWD